MKRHTAPIIAAVLLLLPVLYVGSYLALVRPKGYIHVHTSPVNGIYVCLETVEWYRIAGATPKRIFWPLEQIDRKVRPGAWEQPTGDIPYFTMSSYRRKKRLP